MCSNIFEKSDTPQTRNILAKHYGCRVPEDTPSCGPTNAQASRSRDHLSQSVGLQSIYQLDQTLPAGTADWFKFERMSRGSWKGGV
jgi:hypothetical protein